MPPHVARRSPGRSHAASSASTPLASAPVPPTSTCPGSSARSPPRRHRRGGARILGVNVFGGSCARVCPTEVLCEGACVYQTLLKAPIQIGRLQRYASDAPALPVLRPTIDRPARTTARGSPCSAPDPRAWPPRAAAQWGYAVTSSRPAAGRRAGHLGIARYRSPPSSPWPRSRPPVDRIESRLPPAHGWRTESRGRLPRAA